jgi:hypothetical protein
VTRLVTDQEKPEKFPGAKLVPGISRVNEICQHSDSGIAKVPGTGLAPGWEAGLLASRLVAAGAWHLLRGRTCCVDKICQHSDFGIAMVLGTMLGGCAQMQRDWGLG